ncbi:transmembrane protein 54b isoform X2 [Trichomycterus rosablanca]
MKFGLYLVLVGHVNFLLGALVHGTVLRHVSLNTQTLKYAVSNILALTAGLVGIIVGVLTIILSKNKQNRLLVWCVCMLGAVGGALAASSIVGLLLSLVWAFIYGTKGLLLHCNLSDGMSYFSITTECHFDPTRIFSTTLILWFPLIVMSVLELVFSGSCCAMSISFIRHKSEMHCETRSAKNLAAAEPLVLSFHAPPRHCHSNSKFVQHPEELELLRASRPYSSSRSAQNRPTSPRFDRGSLNRASFWI